MNGTIKIDNTELHRIIRGVLAVRAPGFRITQIKGGSFTYVPSLEVDFTDDPEEVTTAQPAEEQP